MPRTLTVSRVRVRAGREAEYLAAVRELAALHAARGRRAVGVPPRAGRAGAVPGVQRERRRGERTAPWRVPPEDERRLEARIRAVAEYEDGAWDLWQEVRSEP